MTARLAENGRSVEVFRKAVVVLKLRSSCVERCSYLHEVAEEEVDRMNVETALLVLGDLWADMSSLHSPDRFSGPSRSRVNKRAGIVEMADHRQVCGWNFFNTCRTSF